MEIVSFLMLLLGFGLIAFLAFYNEYDRMLKRRKPEYFGLDTFHQVTQWQTSEWQYNANRKGITKAEWQHLRDQHLDWLENALLN
jgi:hypothetical protein